MAKKRNPIIWMYEQGFSFEDILCLDIPYREILHGLRYAYEKTQDEFYRQEYLKHCSYEDLEEDQYMIIGDDHRGSKSENPGYTEKAFAVAKKLGIKTVIHGGDIGDGMIDPAAQYNSFEKQINHIIESYPRIQGIKHKLVLGNHDKKYRNNGMNLAKVLPKEREDIDVWDYHVAHFRIHSHLLTLEHGYCLEYRHNWYLQPQLRLNAHSHELRFRQDQISIPSLCNNDIEFYKEVGKTYRPGFIILNIEKSANYDLFCFEGYQFEKENLTKSCEKSYYVKKLTKSK